MKIVVLGGTRFIGRALVAKLVSLGHDVHVLSKPERAALASSTGATAHPGDRHDEQALAGLPACDAVVDFLAMDRADADRAVRAFHGRCARYLAISTGAIYWVQEATRCPWIESDDSLRLRDRALCDAEEFDYGVAKREMEAGFRDAADRSGFPITLVRAPVVSGPGDWRKRDLYWVRRLLEEKPCILPDGGLNVFNHVYVDDLVDLLIRLCADRALPPGSALNAADRVFTTLRDYVGWLGHVARRTPRFASVPRAALSTAHLHDRSFFFADTKSHVLDNRKAESVTGLAFRTPDLWMPPTVAWCHEEIARSPLSAQDAARLEAEARVVASAAT